MMSGAMTAEQLEDIRARVEEFEGVACFRHCEDEVQRILQEDVPALLGEVQRLRDELASARQVLGMHLLDAKQGARESLSLTAPANPTFALASTGIYVDTSRNVKSPSVCGSCQIMRASSSGWVPSTCDECGAPVHHCTTLSFTVATAGSR